MRIMWIAVFGVLGVFGRYYGGIAIGRVLPPTFPFGTLFINIIGSFFIGVVYVLGVEKVALNADIRVGILVGLLGGFTTFSSYCLDSVRLFEEGRYLAGCLYFGGSPALGAMAALAGMLFVRALLVVA